MTDTTELWTGAFGDKYTERNPTDTALAGRIHMWRKILRHITPDTVLEIGAGAGTNLAAIKDRRPSIKVFAAEPNASARKVLVDNGICHPDRISPNEVGEIGMLGSSVDLVFTSGVLIHIHPDGLHKSMDEIHRISRRWIACIEYFNATPVSIPYRGHDNALWKRDFGAEYLDRFSDLECMDYGFEWKRDTGLDNLTWWLFRKK